MSSTTPSSGAPPSLSAMERDVLFAGTEHYLQAGRDMKNWWDDAYAADRFETKFPLSHSPRQGDTSFGFFDTAVVQGRKMRVMGNYQTMFFDHAKAPDSGEAGQALWMRDQMREFVLRYFMRVSDFSQPKATPDPGVKEPPPLLRPLSWCWEGDPSEIGFGFFQLATKRTGESKWHETPHDQQSRVTDLRRLGPEIDQMLLWVRIFDFAFELSPLGAGRPKVSFPMQEGSYLVMDPDWVIARDDPSPDVLGHYGLGYSFAKEPFPGMVGYGPGEFEAAFELIEFIVHRNGVIQVDMTFVANLPDRLLNFSLDPLTWFSGLGAAALGAMGSQAAPALAALRRRSPLRMFRIDPIFAMVRGLNIATLGQAESRLCISKDQLLRDFLLKHFVQHFQTVAGALRTWRQIPDWAEEAALPPWIVAGTSS